VFQATSPALRRFLVAVGVLALVGAGAVAAWRALAGAPALVHAGEGPQVCLVCVENALPTSFRLTAERISRTYRLTREATVLVRFGGGEVTFGGEPLAPGCHLVWGEAGTRLTLADARGVTVRWPVPAGGCEG
jgi:hypothetical protein